VSDEFGDYRDELRRALRRPNVEIKIQEDFKPLGGDTLALPETYVESCDVVLHFIGDIAGSARKADLRGSPQEGWESCKSVRSITSVSAGIV
jgi:hypothetical protein